MQILIAFIVDALVRKDSTFTVGTVLIPMVKVESYRKYGTIFKVWFYLYHWHQAILKVGFYVYLYRWDPKGKVRILP